MCSSILPLLHTPVFYPPPSVTSTLSFPVHHLDISNSFKSFFTASQPFYIFPSPSFTSRRPPLTSSRTSPPPFARSSSSVLYNYTIHTLFFIFIFSSSPLLLNLPHLIFILLLHLLLLSSSLRPFLLLLSLILHLLLRADHVYSSTPLTSSFASSSPFDIFSSSFLYSYISPFVLIIFILLLPLLLRLLLPHPSIFSPPPFSTPIPPSSC
ncbi:unnamed protein product [Acanthosepion pharaonis]|uniref:Uncharacterized protein n=1 Tax=Acanthosepion pharaonis TaxID=158019 RepID=A0A812BHR2_ACAPH|nr:unnamed protein product [Sepia pharaonis]